MAGTPQIGIVITGDSSQLVAAADAAQKKLAEMSGQTVQQMQRDSANILKDAKRNQWQTFQLYQQVQDFSLQIAGGQNPLLALAQQGSQLTAIYGSAAAALRATGGAVVAGITNPFVLAAAAVGGLGYAFYVGDEQSADFRKALALTGNAAGQTADSFNALVTSVATATDQGAGKVRDFAQAIVASGRFGAQGLQEITTLAVSMASHTGQGVDATVQSLARLKDAPAAFAKEQNKQLNFLSDAQLQHVERLEAYGKREEAAQLVREALIKRFPQVAKENLGSLEQFTKTVGGWFSSMWDNLVGIGRDKTIPEQIQETVEKIKKAQSNLLTNPAPGLEMMYSEGARAELPELTNKLRMLQSQQGAAVRLADYRAQVAAEEARKTEARQLAERLGPMQRALFIAKEEFSARQQSNALEMQIAVLRQQQGQSNSPELQSILARQIAGKELLAIEVRRKALNKEAAIAQGAPSKGPEDDIAKAQNLLSIKGRIADLDASGKSINLDLAAQLQQYDERRLLAQQQILALKNEEYQKFADEKIGSLRRASDLERQLTASKFASPEEGQRYLDRQRLQDMENAATSKISASEVLTLAEKEQQVLQTTNVFKRERNALEESWQQIFDRTYNGNAGVNKALQDYGENAKRAGLAAYNATTKMTSALEDGLTTAIKSGQWEFSSLVDQIIADVVRLKIVRPMLDSIFSMGKTDGGNSIASFFSSLFGSANGNAFGPSGVIPFAKGGVVNRPTIFPFAKGTGLMGEAGPEAIMPLGRDSQGRLGVRGGSGGGNVQVNIINNAGAQVSQSQRQQGDTTIIDVLVAQVEDRLAGNVASGSGSLFHAMGNTFGMRRAVS
jgi:lambda family phage tail tape measure protein